MEVTYISSFRDQWRCALYAFSHRPDLLLKLMLPVILVTLQFSKHLSLPGFGITGWQHLLLAFVISAIGYTIFTSLILQLIITIRVLSPASKRRCTSTITADGFCDITQAKTKAVAWPEISQVRYHHGDIFFSRSGKDGNFVPRSAFQDLAHAQAFFETAHRYWMDAKSGRLVTVPHDETVWPPAPRSGA